MQLMTTRELLQKAKGAAPLLASVDTDRKNRALLAMADALEEDMSIILKANALDMDAAKDKINPVMLDRLCLTEGRVRSMAAGIRQVVSLPDPVGAVRSRECRPNGMVMRVRCRVRRAAAVRNLL